MILLFCFRNNLALFWEKIMRNFAVATLSLMAVCYGVNGGDISNDIYYLRNKNSTESGDFYVQNTRTYSSVGANFSQTYSNGTLIFGNKSQSTGSGSVWFGGNGLQGGFVGYITAKFKAQNIYLTGTTGAGNSFATGGGASLGFEAANTLTLENWNLSFTTAGTQHSNAFLKAQTIKASGISISDHTGGELSFEAQSLNVQAKSVELHGSTLSFKNPGTIDIGSLKANGARIQSTHMDGYYLSTSGGASLKQSADDAQGLATLELKGTYSVRASALNAGKQSLVFKNLSKLSAQNLEARTWGAYGATLNFDAVRAMQIEELSLIWNSAADTAYPTFDSSKSAGADIQITTLTSAGGVFRTSSNGSVKIGNITASQTEFDALGLQAKSLSWQTWDKEGGEKIAGAYESRNNALKIEGLITPDSQGLHLSGASVDGLKARLVLQGSSLDTYGVFGFARFANLDFRDSQAVFHHLSNEGVMSLNNSSVLVKGDLQNRGSIAMNLNAATLNPIVVYGKGHLLQGSEFRLINLASFKGLKLEEEYTILDTKGGIVYGGLGDVLESVKFFDGEKRLDEGKRIFKYGDFSIVKTKTGKSLGFRIDTLNDPNPYSKHRIEHYLYKKGGDKLVQEVDSVGGGVMEALQNLMVTKNNVLWASQVLNAQDRDHTLRVGKTLAQSAEQLGSIRRKTGEIDFLKFATQTARGNRLAKLSLQRQIYKPQKESNLWSSAFAGRGFLQSGQRTLYGMSFGFDELKDNFLLGTYISYGYETYKEGLISNQSNNAQVGLYNRVFVGRHEFDFEANGLIGWNNELISGNEAITSQLNQTYFYNAKSANVNFDYGYAFNFWQEALALKPIATLAYSYLVSSDIDGEISNVFYRDLAVQMEKNNVHNLALSVGLETRMSLNQNSYWWVLLKASKDMYSSSSNHKATHLGGGAFEVKDFEEELNFALSLGGEIRLFERAFVNFSLGSSLGSAQKEGRLAGNLGVEYAF